MTVMKNFYDWLMHGDRLLFIAGPVSLSISLLILMYKTYKKKIK